MEIEITEAPASPINQKEPQTQVKAKSEKTSKAWLIFLIIGIVTFFGGAGCFAYILLTPAEELAEIVFPALPSETKTDTAIYSVLTGEEIDDASLNDSPTYCIQVPNGTDGARPQAGLTDASLLFEAIAEAGITRFAAIYQNPTSAVIGPIRSIRLYYLEWDTPFDCTIVHAGGSIEAINAIKEGDYRDQTENYTYMYRGTYSNRLWNNLFTTSSYLNQFGNDYGYTTSNPTGFTHQTPDEAKQNLVDSLSSNPLEITTPTAESTFTLEPQVTHLEFNFGRNSNNFDVRYDYNSETNTYDRSYRSGTAHEVYECPTDNLGEKDPEDACELTQLSPSVVIAMVVEERLHDDGVHEAITTVGSNTAYIFQNGTAIEGTWKKDSVAEQIHFYDTEGNEISLIPGQTIISAIPTYGSVDYQ